MKRVLMILLLMIATLLLMSCGWITEPDKPWEYRYNVQATYTRDPAKIRCPDGMEPPYLFGELNDPQIPGGQDHINIQMTKVAENKYSCIIPKIWVSSSNIYHVVRVQDCKLGIPGDSTFQSCMTGENIGIPGSYNQKIVPNSLGGSELWFMIK